MDGKAGNDRMSAAARALLRHLPSLPILHWGKEYSRDTLVSDLLAALMDEHRPAGMTERHLIEELATIIWRKRRVLLAEGAKINEGLKSAANSSKSVMSANSGASWTLIPAEAGQ